MEHEKIDLLSDIDIPEYKSYDDTDDEIDSIVFGSGGMKGICFVGCLKALENLNILQNIKRVCGVSAGAIIGFFLVIGYSPDEILKIVIKLNFTKLTSPSIKNIYSGSIDDGSRFNKVLSKFLTLKGFSPKITLKELYKKTGKEFIIYVYNSTKKRKEIFSYKTEPYLDVINAVRMSSAIPLYFQAVEHKGCIYFDGALGNSFPIDHFQNIKKVIGFRIIATHIDDVSVKNIESGIISLYDSFHIKGNNISDSYKDFYLDISPDFSILSFNLPKDEKIKAVKDAYIHTLRYCLKRFL